VVEGGVVRQITKFVEIDFSHGEYIGLAKIIDKDARLFREILEKIVSKDQNAYYDYAFAPFSQKTFLNLVSTKGLPWTEIDDLKDFEYAKQLIAEGKVK